MRFLAAIAMCFGDIIVYKAIPAIVRQLPHETQDKMWGSVALLCAVVVVNVVVLAWATAPLRGGAN